MSYFYKLIMHFNLQFVKTVGNIIVNRYIYL